MATAVRGIDTPCWYRRSARPERSLWCECSPQCHITSRVSMLSLAKRRFICVCRPQKIHMATGKGLVSLLVVAMRLSLYVYSRHLVDQVTYPVRIDPADRTTEIEKNCNNCLILSAGYLVTRWAGDAVGKKRADHGADHETKWEEVLSKYAPSRLPLHFHLLIHSTHALHRSGRATTNWNEQVFYHRKYFGSLQRASYMASSTEAFQL